MNKTSGSSALLRVACVKRKDIIVLMSSLGMLSQRCRDHVVCAVSLKEPVVCGKGGGYEHDGSTIVLQPSIGLARACVCVSERAL